MNPTLLAIAVTFSVSLPAQTAHFWISASKGKDTNPGTKALPFKTLEKGLKIRTSNVVVHIMPGVYGPKTTGDFFDATAKTEKDMVLRNYSNVKFIGDDRDTCIIDFNGQGGKFWGFISVRGAATDRFEITNLTFQNIVPNVWGSHWGCGAVIVNGGAGKVDVHGCHFIDANAAWINWGAGTDNAFHHNLVRRTVPNTHANAIRVRHNAGSTTYIYNNTIINQDVGIGIAKKGIEYVCNNLIIDSGKGMANDASQSLTGILENNNCFGNGTNYTGKWSATNISKDPQLVDKAKANVRLKSTSPCVEAGYTKFLKYQLNDYYLGASCVDTNKDGDAGPDIGCHELSITSLTIPTPWVQGKAPAVSFTSSDKSYVLGVFLLGIIPAGSKTVPFYKANPFGTIGMDTSTILRLTLTALPSGAKWNPLGLVIPVLPGLNNLTLYAQGFAYTRTVNGDRFQATGVRAITL